MILFGDRAFGRRLRELTYEIRRSFAFTKSASVSSRLWKRKFPNGGIVHPANQRYKAFPWMPRKYRRDHQCNSRVMTRVIDIRVALPRSPSNLDTVLDDMLDDTEPSHKTLHILNAPLVRFILFPYSSILILEVLLLKPIRSVFAKFASQLSTTRARLRPANTVPSVSR